MPTSDRVLPAAIGLRAHGAYACRHSGACCTSGWTIPVEARLHRRVTKALGSGRLTAHAHPPLVAGGTLPAGCASILGSHEGRCAFHDPVAHRCELHAILGPRGKPSACQQFPFVTVRDPRGTFVSLSHYCPSAAALLDDDGALALQAMPAAAGTFEGLDVRTSLPPAVDAARLLDWDALHAWEAAGLTVLSAAGDPDVALADLRACHAHLARWRPGRGTQAAWIASWTPAAADRRCAPVAPQLDALIRDAAPERPGGRQPTPAAAWTPAVAEGWAPLRPMACRYLAARFVACWPLHCGHGLTTQLAYLEALLAVLRTEFARAAGGAVPGPAQLRDAARASELLAVHLADPVDLARRLDAVRFRNRWTS